MPWVVTRQRVEGCAHVARSTRPTGVEACARKLRAPGAPGHSLLETVITRISQPLVSARLSPQTRVVIFEFAHEMNTRESPRLAGFSPPLGELVETLGAAQRRPPSTTSPCPATKSACGSAAQGPGMRHDDQHGGYWHRPQSPWAHLPQHGQRNCRGVCRQGCAHTSRPSTLSGHSASATLPAVCWRSNPTAGVSAR